MIGLFLLGLMVVFGVSFAAGITAAVLVSGRRWNAWMIGALLWALCCWAWVPAFFFAGVLVAKAVGYRSVPSADQSLPFMGVSMTIVPSLCVGFMLWRGTGRRSVFWVSAILALVTCVLVTRAWVVTAGVLWETTVLLWLAWWAINERPVSRRKRGVCPRCLYDLAGLPSGHVCPECGASLSGR